MHKILMQARCIATICEVQDRWIKVKESPLFVNNSIATWKRLYQGENLVGCKVKIKVRQLMLDEERVLWDARVIGDLL